MQRVRNRNHGHRIGRSNGAMPTPAQLPLTAWVRGSYTGSPWVGEVGGDWVSASPPLVGAALNGYTPADTNVVTDNRYLRNTSKYLEEVISISDASGTLAEPPGPGTSVFFLFKADSLAADDAANPYNNPGIISTNAGGYLTIAVSDAGLRVAVYDGSYKQVTVPGVSAGTWYVGHVWYDGTNLKASINRGSPQTTAAGLPSNPGGSTWRMQLCSDYSSNNEFDGVLMEAGFSKTVFTDADRKLVNDYISDRYRLSL